MSDWKLLLELEILVDTLEYVAIWAKHSYLVLKGLDLNSPRRLDLNPDSVNVDLTHCYPQIFYSRKFLIRFNDEQKTRRSSE